MKANEPWARATEGLHTKPYQLPSTPNIPEQENGYFSAEGAVRLACAISRQPDILSIGVPWIASPSEIKARSTFAGQGVLWGDGVLWDGNVPWGGHTRNDSNMMCRQPSWANGVLWGDHLTLGGRTRWQEKVGAHSLPGTTSNKWHPAFIAPKSIDARMPTQC